MSRASAALLVILGALCISAPARAYKRIAVLQPDGELLRAISIALSPWDVETLRSEAPLPGSSQPEAIRTATGLADELGVEALVWVTRSEQGSLLWVFDNRGDVTSRALVETPPFDSAAAAAVALSVKTILRSSVVAALEESKATAAKPAPLDEPIAAAELGAGVRWLEPEAVDFRLELSGVFWLALARRLGVGLEVSWGPGLQIEDPEFRGTYRDVAAGAVARLRLIDARPISLIASLGGALHWATLEGTVASSASSVSRVNGSVNLKVLLALRVAPRTYLGTTLGAAYQLAYQRYLVDGRPVFSPSRLTVSWAGNLGIDLF